MIDFFSTWLTNTFQIIQESSLFLLAGFLFAGLAHAFIPFSWIRNQLGKPGLSSIFKSSILGLPLPLCSCSVIPVAASLRKAGASKGSTASFLVSTPEIGIDSFALSTALLGLPFTIFRTITAFITAMVAGLFVEKLTKEEAYETKESSCCGHQDEQQKGLTEALRFAFVELPADLSKLLLLGFFAAGLAKCLIPDNLFFFSELGSLSSMLVMLVASIPVYVCATAMTPLAAVLVSKGLGAGAALVFLMAGPATNIATILAAKKLLGQKGMVAYLTSITGTSILAGLTLESLPTGLMSLNLDSNTHSHQGASVLAIILIALLGLPLVKSIYRKKPKSDCGSGC